LAWYTLGTTFREEKRGSQESGPLLALQDPAGLETLPGRDVAQREGSAPIRPSRQILYPDGRYVLRRTENRKTVWVPAGVDAMHARAEQILAESRLVAQNAAQAAGTQIVETGGRVHLRRKALAYIERQEARGKLSHVERFRSAFAEFMVSTGADYADQLSEQKVLRWYADMRRKGNEDRTIHNKHISVFGFLRWAGIDTKALAARAPKYTKKEVEVYEPGEMKLFFDSLRKPYHRIVFAVLLKTGLRMQEAMFLEWRNFNFDRGTLTLRERDAEGFEIKDRAERTLPVPADLVEQLKVWKETHGGQLVLGTSNDTPNWKWLSLLKSLVRKAGLNCGHCQPCYERKECERWNLHKFRATYTTNLLRAGIDARTVMKYTGHEDLETILRYLAPAEGAETQAKVNAIVWTK
jgi:integrase